MKYTFDGKSKLASFGVWPGISLEEARERRNDAKQKIKSGKNPVEEKRRNKLLKEMRSKDKNNNESFHNLGCFKRKTGRDSLACMHSR